MFAIALCIFVLDITNDYMKWFWLSFFVAAKGFHAILEWKYLKGSRQYLISLILLAVGIVYFYLVIW
ncbi:DUF4181 domain-containing protein [Paenibacillus glycanilyticus]|uniref:DUF4181 domain-containing protein n=1 Tax=Paenibacillus glycanilyticus TaxID=126569 RepID=UPI003DA65D1F